MLAGGGLFVVPPLLFAAVGRKKCSPQDCAGRSLCPAEARNCSQMLTCVLRRLPPENISLIHTRQPNP